MEGNQVRAVALVLAFTVAAKFLAHPQDSIMRWVVACSVAALALTTDTLLPKRIR